jgi:amidohydrolase
MHVLALAALLAATPLEERIQREVPALVETYRALHAAPELSMKEAKTSAFVAKRLRDLGYDVTERVGKYPIPDETCYGVVAVMKNGDGPVVLVRSDMDALPVTEQTGLPYASANPGVMHACGHDVHMTSLIGAAKMLAEMKSRWRGTVVLIGQPAEEIVRGAEGMIADGLFQRFPKPNYSIALHDVAFLETGKVGYVTGPIFAGSDSVDVTIRGVGGHGAMPHVTKDPVVVAAEFVMALQTIVSRERSPLDPVVVTVGKIDGGTKRNIIPDDVRLYLTVRTFKPDVRERVLASIERIAKGISMAAAVPDPIVTINTAESVPPTVNDAALTMRLAKALGQELGEANVVQVDPQTVAEDFGKYGTAAGVASCLLNLGAADPAAVAAGTQPGLHSSRFAPWKVETALATGVRAITTAVFELLPAK